MHSEKKIQAGEVTVEEAVLDALEQIEKKEDAIHSYVTVLEKEAILEKSKRNTEKIDAGELTGPLAGVPVAIKDNMCTEGVLTTCSSKILYNFVPTYTSEAVKILRRQEQLSSVKQTWMSSRWEAQQRPLLTELRETHTIRSMYRAVLPAVPVRQLRGGMFLCACSDTGGSIRQPSSFCGVTGIKPTYGTVSRYGLIAYGSSLDQIGPIAKDVTDCATILEAISSYDKKDSTSVAREDTDFTSALVEDVKGMKIGIPKDYFGEGLDSEVKDAIFKAAEVLKQKGAIVEEFDLSLVEYAIPAYYVIASAEASSNLSRFDGVKYGYRTEEYEGLHNMYKRAVPKALARK